MRKITFTLLTAICSLVAFAQTPIITMIVDGDCSGGTPKVIEIYADGEVDFTQYKLQNQTNNSTTWSADFDLTNFGTVTNSFIYVYTDNNSGIFAAEFPNATQSESSDVANFNGDDRIRIIKTDGTVIDQYGVTDERGTGKYWEYKDGYGKRKSGTAANGGNFTQDDWDFYKNGLKGKGLCKGGSETIESLTNAASYTSGGGATTCALSLSAAEVTCNAFTAGIDTYTITIPFTGGGLGGYLLSTSSGTFVGNDPSSDATGNIIIAGVNEGTDVTLTITGNSCDITRTITSPTCAMTTTVNSIQELRAGNVGDEYILASQAILTFQQTFRNQKYIQDDTAAILIDDNSGVITTTYQVGDGITGIKGTLATYNGIMQFVPVENTQVASSSGNTVTPKVVSIEDYKQNAANYQSQLIMLENVSITEGNGTAKFEKGKNYTIAREGHDMVLRTQFYGADYINTVIPNGVLSHITGIAATHTNSNNGQVTYQIFPRELSDFGGLSLRNNSIEGVSVYPNPANDVVMISLADTKNAKVVIYNILGNEVMTKNLSGEMKLDVKSLSSGIYILKINQDNNTYVQKLIIE